MNKDTNQTKVRRRAFRKSYLFALLVMGITLTVVADQSKARPSRSDLETAIGVLAPQLSQKWQRQLAEQVRQAGENLKVPEHNRIYEQPVDKAALLLAQIWVESRFNPRARSRSNAQGLMQVKPSTAHLLIKSFGLPKKRSYYGVKENIQLGVKYMNDLFIQFPDVRSAALAYNIGPAAYRRGKMNLFYWKRIRNTYGLITQYGR
jgi:soluble lytic murein transglycosylase-like protein